MQEGNDLRPAPSETDHVRGSLAAPVVITEYADFECPYCGDANRVLESLLARYGSKVALVFRHFPLPMHPDAEPAAEAAEAAAQAGKFWAMHDLLFRSQRALGLADLRRYAEEIGIDPGAVERAVRERGFAERIERDVDSGEESNVEGTPSLFINGFAYDDEITVEGVSAVIDRALASVASGARG